MEVYSDVIRAIRSARTVAVIETIVGDRNSMQVDIRCVDHLRHNLFQIAHPQQSHVHLKLVLQTVSERA